ncbi:MAG: yyaT [Paenibacillus sp.]|nr:yyaT [Paenibacillus sp.]
MNELELEEGIVSVKMKVITVTNEQDLQKCLKIRTEVFVKEQGVAEEQEVDDYDQSPDSCIHFLLLNEEGYPIGASRMKPYETEGVKLQRIAVLQKERGKGLGRLLLNAMEQKAVGEQAKYAVLDAQVQAVPFYSKQGYIVSSKIPFYDAGIEHLQMRKQL